MDTVNPYDEILYPGRPYPPTHPDRLAAVATLAGMTPAPAGRCRVLEVACGDAANLIPMAYALPGSEFVGFDLAARPIERGRQLAQALGLRNLTLRELDIRSFPSDAGSFDYIIAHGLYSWIGAELRDGLLALIADHLAPQGVAFVSYNAYPGCYRRRMVWDMLRFHTDHLPDPQLRISEAKALAQLLARGCNAGGESIDAFKAELQRILERDPAHLFHDDLAAVNDPVYFHQFVDHTQRHGLQFVGEAELAASGYGGLTPEARRVLDALDPLAREQYLDYVVCRQFRQSVVCRVDVTLDRTRDAARLEGLTLAGRGRVVTTPHGPQAASGSAPVLDRADRDAAAVLEVMFEVLAEVAPRRLSPAALTRRIADRQAGLRSCEPAYVRQIALGAALAGRVVLHGGEPRLVAEPGASPFASLLARLQLTGGSIVTTLCHEQVQIDDELARRILLLLDGTRTRAILLAELGEALSGENETARAATLEAHLRQFAKLGLLLA